MRGMARQVEFGARTKDVQRGGGHDHHFAHHLHALVALAHLENAQHTREAQHADDGELRAFTADGKLHIPELSRGRSIVSRTPSQ